MVAWPIADIVSYYDQRIASLEDTEYADFWEEEVLLLLSNRDGLHDRWSELSTEQRSHVLSLDKWLVIHHQLISEYAGLPNPNVTDRSYWWWFLHEGPQVMEQALAAPRDVA